MAGLTAAVVAAATAVCAALPSAQGAPPARQRRHVSARGDDAEFDVRQQDQLRRLEHAARNVAVRSVEAPQHRFLPQPQRRDSGAVGADSKD